MSTLLPNTRRIQGEINKRHPFELFGVMLDRLGKGYAEQE